MFIVCIRNTEIFKLIPLLCTHIYSYMFSTVHPPRVALSFLMKNLTIDVWVSSDSHATLLSYDNNSLSPLSTLVRVRIWAQRQARGSWSAHGFNGVLLSRLWVNFCVTVFVCLMQSLSYVLWMKKKFKKLVQCFIIREHVNMLYH